MTYEIDARTNEFKVDAPAPTPSPFTIKGDVAEERIFVSPFVLSHWTDTPDARVEMESLLTIEALGSTRGKLYPRAGSELAAILCNEEEVDFDNTGIDSTGFVRYKGSFTVESDRPDNYDHEVKKARCLT